MGRRACSPSEGGPVRRRVAARERRRVVRRRLDGEAAAGANAARAVVVVRHRHRLTCNSVGIQMLLISSWSLSKQ